MQQAPNSSMYICRRVSNVPFWSRISGRRPPSLGSETVLDHANWRMNPHLLVFFSPQDRWTYHSWINPSTCVGLYAGEARRRDSTYDTSIIVEKMKYSQAIKQCVGVFRIVDLATLPSFHDVGRPVTDETGNRLKVALSYTRDKKYATIEPVRQRPLLRRKKDD